MPCTLVIGKHARFGTADPMELYVLAETRRGPASMNAESPVLAAEVERASTLGG
jgi:hypothetical protein